MIETLRTIRKNANFTIRIQVPETDQQGLSLHLCLCAAEPWRNCRFHDTLRFFSHSYGKSPLINQIIYSYSSIYIYIPYIYISHIYIYPIYIYIPYIYIPYIYIPYIYIPYIYPIYIPYIYISNIYIPYIYIYPIYISHVYIYIHIILYICVCEMCIYIYTRYM